MSARAARKKGRDYIVTQTAKDVWAEEIGDSLLRVPAPCKPGGAKLCKRKPPTENGRPKGSGARGWTTSTRRRVRIIAEANKDAFRSFAHLHLPDSSKHSVEATKHAFDGLTRWLRTNRIGYLIVVEFKKHSELAHFHAALTCEHDDALEQKLCRYWNKRTKGGEVVYDHRPETPTDAIAGYIRKGKGQKENPAWFDAKPFCPYRSNLKVERGRLHRIPGHVAPEVLGLWKFSHNAVKRLEEAEAEGLTGERALMKRACRTCWSRYGRYISRIANQEICDQCGQPWQYASDA